MECHLESPKWHHDMPNSAQHSVSLKVGPQIRYYLPGKTISKVKYTKLFLNGALYYQVQVYTSKSYLPLLLSAYMTPHIFRIQKQELAKVSFRLKIKN